jgi:protein-tyrosine phosphatase
MVDIELYGGRRAYIAHLRARASYALGWYRSAQTINWGAVERLVFICQGNICRSPYASARARAFGARAISLGIEAVDGVGANEDAARNALPRGIDLKDHRSTRLQASLILPGDLIVVFEPAQLLRVTRQSRTGAAGLTLLGLWAHPVRPHVQDPYGRSDRYFQQCFAAIDRNIRELMNRLSAHGAIAAPGSASGHFRVQSAS